MFSIGAKIQIYYGTGVSGFENADFIGVATLINLTPSYSPLPQPLSEGEGSCERV